MNLVFKSLITTFFFVAWAGAFEWNKTDDNIVPGGSEVSRNYYQDINVTELVLKNGMRVLIKPTMDDEDEVQVRLFAKGGYAAFPEGGVVLADVAIEAGWGSGVGTMTIGQQTLTLYQNSIEMFPMIEANYRAIDGVMPVEAFEDYLQFIKQYFNCQKFSEAEFEKAMNEKNAALKEESASKSVQFQDAYLGVNMSKDESEKYKANQVISKKQFSAAKELYLQSFSNPSEFVCVIVGDVNAKELEKPVIEILGTIPIPEKSHQWSEPKPIEFPTTITHRVIHTHDRHDCVVRLTFPIVKKLSPQAMPIFNLSCKVIEKRLNRLTEPGSRLVLSAGVQDDLPLYPSLETAWMTVQFRCDHQSADKLINKVLNEMKRLHDEGPYPSEVEEERSKQISTQTSWMYSNEFWMTKLTTVSLWETRLEDVLSDPLKEPQVFEEVRNFIQQAIRIDRYTTVTTTR